MGGGCFCQRRPPAELEPSNSVSLPEETRLNLVGNRLPWSRLISLALPLVPSTAQHSTNWHYLLCHVPCLPPTSLAEYAPSTTLVGRYLPTDARRPGGALLRYYLAASAIPPLSLPPSQSVPISPPSFCTAQAPESRPPLVCTPALHGSPSQHPPTPRQRRADLQNNIPRLLRFVLLQPRFGSLIAVAARPRYPGPRMLCGLPLLCP